MATIYWSRPLTKYQLAMNKAVQQLCLTNPGLIRKRSKLMEQARSSILADGFQFMKGSKNDHPVDSPPPVKRQKLSQDIWDKRLKEIEEDVKDLNDRIGFKEKRIAAAVNVKDFKKCDEIKEEIITLKQSRRELEAEVKHLKHSNSQSKWHHKRKLRLSKSSSSESPFSPSPQSSTTPSCSKSSPPPSRHSSLSRPHSPTGRNRSLSRSR